MSNFICPECGHSSEFDEWDNSAVCPKCGYEPPQGAEMQELLVEQGQEVDGGAVQPTDGGRQESIVARFLPANGRSFLTGLAWGVFAFAIVMLVASRLQWSDSVARCMGITLPVLTTFVIWRLYARRELDQ